MKNSTDEEPTEIMLIDSDFHVAYGRHYTNRTLGIHVINNHRKLILKARDAFEWTSWLRAFRTAIKNNGLQSQYKRNYDSFAPDRSGNKVKFCIDGENHFKHLYREL